MPAKAVTIDPHSTEARRLIRIEARARWALKALEAKLKDDRPGDAELRAIAKALGAGASDTIHDEQGRAIGLYTVMDGRETLDAAAMFTYILAQKRYTEKEAREIFTKKGEPFLAYKEA